ncbi:hypothetical protein Nepgr_016259 [Nepenthes gracilis]|uniref:DNA-directed DNA polymerase n=1 Tax=Nepenthes gracilis TaxID=150966 RepID=A0AAD3SME1_NEPGR|nr:hypothetical protein Nepgr_016259 [Nepenthes gracilis]
MGVSSQTSPFNRSSPSFFWVSYNVRPRSSSSVRSVYRSRFHSLGVAAYRQENQLFQSACGCPTKNGPFIKFIQFRTHDLSSYTKSHAANRCDDMGFSPSYETPFNCSASDQYLSYSIERQNKKYMKNEDELAFDHESASPDIPYFMVSNSDRNCWSSARDGLKGIKNRSSINLRRSGMEIEPLSRKLMNTKQVSLKDVEDGSDYSISDVMASNHVSCSPKLNSLPTGCATRSPHRNINYDSINMLTDKWPNKTRTMEQESCGKVKDATSKIMQGNGSLSEKQLEMEKQEEHKLATDISSNCANGINRENDMATDCHHFDMKAQIICQQNLRTKLCTIYDRVLVVDNIPSARKVVSKLTNQYRHLVHACDTEVSRIDVKQETPVDHGEMTCFCIYSGEGVDFGNGKSCVWVDVLDGPGKDLLSEFAPFFEDSSIKKVWHNYSFDSHVIENYGIKLSGFHADTMHMARLWDSSRRTEGGYSLEALTSNRELMSRNKLHQDEDLFGKISMKTIFGRRKVKKDGSVGKIITIPPIEEIQREDKKPWICYSSLDSISTFKLYESLKCSLSTMPWKINGEIKGSMLNFYETYWRPFGELLVQMETEGILVDRGYLREAEKVAIAEKEAAADRFRNWASRYCPDAKYMNVGSDMQLRQLFFGGIMNRKNAEECLPMERTFRVPNLDMVIEEGKKSPKKYRDIKLFKIGDSIQTDLYTATGWPSVSGDALKILVGKVSAERDLEDDTHELQSLGDSEVEAHNTSAYGTAFAAFGEESEGKKACQAIAALCEVCSIDSLISNFILPLQGRHVVGHDGRIHCSLNINTETGRLSARRPNLQNQPALEKDRYKIRQAFIAAPGKSLIVADYGQLELRILAHLSGCKSMKEAFKAGGDFHSRTAMNMYPYIREAVKRKQVLLEWHPRPGVDKPPVPLLKDAFASERRKAKMLNFSIAYGKTPMGLARDWKVSVKEAKATVDLWYKERQEVLRWQEEQKKEAAAHCRVRTLLGRTRRFPSATNAASQLQRGHIERAAINTPVQGSAADVAMCAMLEIAKNKRLKELGWKLLLQVHDEVILEGPTESAETARSLVVRCMSKPFDGTNILEVDLVVDAKCAQNWYAAK